MGGDEVNTGSRNLADRQRSAISRKRQMFAARQSLAK
jgi:hypothetical protein